MKRILCVLLFSLGAVFIPYAAVFPQQEQLSAESVVSDLIGDDAVKRGAALRYIDEKAPVDIAEALGNILAGGGNPAEKKQALSALQHYPYAKVAAVYPRVLKETQSFIIKKAVIDIMGRSNDRSIVIPVSFELESPFFAVRESAILALREIGDDRMFPVIFRMSASKDPVQRVYALEALNYLYDLRLFSVVQKLLADENKSVRILALQCVEKNYLDKLLPAVRNIALSDENGEARVAAVQTLGKMKDTNSLSVLLKTLTSENRDVRFSSAVVLGQFRLRQSPYYISEQLNAESDNEIKSVLLDTLIEMKENGGYKGFETILSGE
ncbi:MAG: HEAT repeat domain-containing protein, partial [Spirochaetota bacterium]